MKPSASKFPREFTILLLLLIPACLVCFVFFFAAEPLAGKESNSILRGLNYTFRVIFDEHNSDPAGIKVEELIAQLKSSRDTERHAIISKMGQGHAKPWSQQVIPILLKILKSKDDPARLDAAYAIIGLGQSAREVIPEMVECLADPDGELRNAAITFLVNMGRETQRPLQRALESGDDRSFASAAMALSNNDNIRLKLHLKRLRSLVQHEDNTIRSHVAKALGHTGVASVKEDLKKLLLDNDPRVREMAVKSLGQCNDDQSAILHDLLLLLQDEDCAVRQRVATTLSQCQDDGTILKYLEEQASREYDDESLQVLERAIDRLSRKISVK